MPSSDSSALASLITSGSAAIAVHSGTYRQKAASGKKMARVTEAMSQAVAQFSRDVVRSIRQAPRDRAGLELPDGPRPATGL